MFYLRIPLELIFDVVVIPVRTAAGDHFADEAGHKQLCSQQDGNQSQIEKRLVGYWSEIQPLALLHKLVDNEPQCDEASCEKHQYPGKTEEVHRFLAESAQEPQ